MIDDDNPEWTAEQFARAKRGRDVVPPEVLACFKPSDKMTHEFTIFITGVPFDSHTVDELFDAGCADALVWVSNNKIAIDFAREADTYEAAVASAIADIEKTSAKVVSVEPVVT